MEKLSFFDTLMISDTKALGLIDIFFALVIPFFLMIPVVLFYKSRGNKTLAGHGFLTSILAFAPLTSIITLLIGSNIARAFGLVAALSIIRFRTALKSSIDSIYMFWALAVGMACGTGYYLAAVMIMILVLAFIYLADLFKIEVQNFTNSLVKIEVPKDMEDSVLEKIEEKLEKLFKKVQRVNIVFNSAEESKQIIYNTTLDISKNPSVLESEILSYDKVKKVEVLNSEAALFV